VRAAGYKGPAQSRQSCALGQGTLGHQQVCPRFAGTRLGECGGVKVGSGDRVNDDADGVVVLPRPPSVRSKRRAEPPAPDS